MIMGKNAVRSLCRSLAVTFLASTFLGSFLAGSFTLAAAAEEIAGEFSLVRSTPIPLQGYEESASLPQTLGTAAEVMAILNASKQLPVRMEVIRRAYHDLPPAEGEKLITTLHARHREIQDDPNRFFDYGYAQYMFSQKQTALYFLRKANDRLKSQFTNLAYAMAQAEVDLNEEGALPETLTTRKMDVQYKLSDAVVRDAEAHLPGFWPTFVQVLAKLEPLTAYNDFATTDFTETYVPFGERVMTSYGTTGSAANIDEGTSGEPCQGTPEGSCVLQGTPESLDWGKVFRSISLDLNQDGVNDTVHFFMTDLQNRYRVVAINSDNQVLADFSSPVAPYILEDLDADGLPEMVIRQFKVDPMNPLQVYRFDRCSFKLDPTVEAYFK
jgi:hypothetical protein